MLDTVGSLALEPEFQSFVVICVVVYLALFAAAEIFIKTERARRISECATSVAFILLCVFWGAANGGRELLIDRSMPWQKVSGGSAVRLVDVRSIRGWGEGNPDNVDAGAAVTHGDHQVNKEVGAEVFDRILEQLNLPYSGAKIVDMDQAQWEAFLRGLRPSDRLLIGRIPFAVVDGRSNDGRIRRATLFANDTMEILDREGRVKSRICVDNIFNVPDTFSAQREAIKISYGSGRCL